ncbi:hypothetical protein B0H13DRAFT_709759 [Mycena leptocephala]|nr:hypothetical protein B0H13DRAFT_709759 [Mycena leptocephala]
MSAGCSSTATSSIGACPRFRLCLRLDAEKRPCPPPLRRAAPSAAYSVASSYARKNTLPHVPERCASTNLTCPTNPCLHPLHHPLLAAARARARFNWSRDGCRCWQDRWAGGGSRGTGSRNEIHCCGSDTTHIHTHIALPISSHRHLALPSAPHLLAFRVHRAARYTTLQSIYRLAHSARTIIASFHFSSLDLPAPRFSDHFDPEKCPCSRRVKARLSSFLEKESRD